VLIRSTRILTLDNIEVIVPNGIIGNSRIVNEAGGPSLQQRMRVNVSIAYGSDIDQAREVLLSCCEAVEGVCTTRTPQVRFVAFGASGLDLALLAWVANPEIRDAVLDRLNTRIYKSLGAADIEIPYDKLDLYIKETVDRRDAA
jgi:MscS family membrane protein